MGGKREQIDDDEKSVESYELEVMSFQLQYTVFSRSFQLLRLYIATATKLET
ncbi:hypothetical protein Flavo103_04060 [Flavobacterium collinsii]|nr:hypothetical protein Flavo103_04060 [Flavobacterium collinsii]